MSMINDSAMLFLVVLLVFLASDLVRAFFVAGHIKQGRPFRLKQIGISAIAAGVFALLYFFLRTMSTSTI